jgi:hypothetical protein
MFTKKLTESELEMAVQLVYSIYKKSDCKTENDLADLVSNEFDCNCSPEEVKHLLREVSIEEENMELIYNNII